MTNLPVVAAAAAILLAGGAHAADPARGLALSERWCADCHVVDAEGTGGDAGPPFAAVAGPEDRSDAALAAWIADPHAPMPDFDLAAPEIADIIAHIRTLEGAQ